MNDTLAAWTPRALSVLRIITGLLIIQHGMGKIIGFPVVAAYANVQLMSLIGAAGLIELIGGALLILGLWTQPVAFILAGEMAFAYFIGHMFKAGMAAPVFHPLLNGGTLAALYCFTCLYLSTAGAGPWSVDASMKKA
jgi:putative oxidoreductase